MVLGELEEPRGCLALAQVSVSLTGADELSVVAHQLDLGWKGWALPQMVSQTSPMYVQSPFSHDRLYAWQ